LRKYGYYLSGIGLCIIIWFEVATHMVSSPRFTALLITAIWVSAIILGVLFQRRTWCRYLCPLGKMVGIFSSTSILELRANYGICNNDCIAHSCYTGGQECQSGCPMFEGPFSLRSNVDCIYCGNCIKNCPNQSPQMNLRLPGFELWACRRFEKPVVFLVPLIMSTQIFRGLVEAGYLDFFLGRGVSRPFMLFLLLTAVTALVFLAVKSSERLMLQDVSATKGVSGGMLSYGILFTVVAFEVAYHLERLLLFGGQILPVLGRQFGMNWENLGASGAPWAITTLQVMLVLAGGLGSSVVLKRIYRSFFNEDPAGIPFAWRLPVILTTICYTWLFIAG
jgi:ferredoxin